VEWGELNYWINNKESLKKIENAGWNARDVKKGRYLAFVVKPVYEKCRNNEVRWGNVGVVVELRIY
jgi:hypothetical protein